MSRWAVAAGSQERKLCGRQTKQGLVDPGVIQTPRHVIKARGQQVTLRCSPMSGHLSVSWYQQVLGQGPQFLFEYYNELQREKGNFPDRFSAQQFSNSSSELNASSLELTDSALYLCASSLTQLCVPSGLLRRNTPAPLRKGPRGRLPARAAQPLGKQTGLPQTPVLLHVPTTIILYLLLRSRVLSAASVSFLSFCNAWVAWTLERLSARGHTGAGVSQTPTHRVTGRGQAIVLSCDPISSHVVLYWYRQTLGQGPEFMMFFQNSDAVDQSGMPNARFSAERSGGSSSTLKIERAEPGDSAVYLCASSLTTAWHGHVLPLHKPHISLSSQQ
ncbi:hypothetical protein MC885_018194 [Smutsia gigantea]|nr:hypothetical protein MC885_018194 [Smutsia gigantea]